ncbi:MAG: HEAT repeat domain-containing protein [Candidatus Thorarchaeota archaeon]|nr:HEAT repeat domain-containing protein [Candidatus Thorarchaeota archaeon]
MSLSELLDAVHLGDFPSSTRLLVDLQADESLVHIGFELRKVSEEDTKSSLMIRDHILHFLGGFPVYAALDICSLDLLETFSYTTSRQHACEEFLEMVQLLFAEKDTRFLDRFLEIEDLAGNQFMIFVTDLLDRRIDEMSTVKIPFSVLRVDGQTRERYLISHLWSTSYGRKILAGVGIKQDVQVVGKGVWDEISRVVNDLDYDVSRMLKEVDLAEWASLTSGSGRALEHRSRELEGLDVLRTVMNAMNSSDRGMRLSGLHQFQQLGSVVYLDRVTNIARTGTLEERCIAIDILGEMGSDKHEDLLTSFLNSEDSTIRLRSANAISLIASRDFMRESKISASTTDSVEVLNTATFNPSGFKPKNRFERLDAAKLFVNIDSELAEQRFLDLYSQLDSTSKLELVHYAFSLRRRRAEILIRCALKDSDPIVSEAALYVGRQIWPNNEWDHMPEHEDSEE